MKSIEAIDAGATTVKALNRQLGVGAAMRCVRQAALKNVYLKARQTATKRPKPAYVFPIASTRYCGINYAKITLLSAAQSYLTHHLQHIPNRVNCYDSFFNVMHTRHAKQR